MKKLLINIYIVLTITTIISPQLYANKLRTAHLNSNVTETITAENELLTTILNNALILVQQIKTNTHHEKERTTAIKNIDNAFKQLSSENKYKIKADLIFIKQEAQSFSNVRGPLQKYNSANAERSLKNISSIIQQLVESKTETVVSEVQEELMSAISKTEEIKIKAQSIIIKARAELALNRITPVQAAKIIGEQQYIVGASERSLKKESTKAQETVEQTDNQASYLAQFTSNIYNLGAKALAPFKAGYGYTQEEKDVARAIITQLELQLASITNTYQAAIEQSENPRERAELQHAFKLMADNIYNEMHQQQIITGEVMSTNRKLFWGTVAVAGAVAGYYLMTPTEAPVVPVISKENDTQIQELKKIDVNDQQEQQAAAIADKAARDLEEEQKQAVAIANKAARDLEEEQKQAAAIADKAARDLEEEQKQAVAIADKAARDLEKQQKQAAAIADKAARDLEEEQKQAAAIADKAARDLEKQKQRDAEADAAQVQLDEQQSILNELNAEAAAAAEQAAREQKEQEQRDADADAAQVQLDEQQSILNELNDEAAAAAEKAAREQKEQEQRDAEADAAQVQLDEQQSILNELNDEAAAAEKVTRDQLEQERLDAEADAAQVQLEEQQSILNELNDEAAAAAEKAAREQQEQKQRDVDARYHYQQKQLNANYEQRQKRLKQLDDEAAARDPEEQKQRDADAAAEKAAREQKEQEQRDAEAAAAQVQLEEQQSILNELNDEAAAAAKQAVRNRQEQEQRHEGPVGAPALGGTAYQRELELSKNYQYNKQQAQEHGSWYRYFNQPEEGQTAWKSLKDNPISNKAREYLGPPTKAERWLLGLPEPTQEKQKTKK